MSSLGFFLSTHMSHTSNVRQTISFVTVLMAFMPPVFYFVYTTGGVKVSGLCHTYNTIFSHNTTYDGISYAERLADISCIQYPGSISNCIYSFSQYKGTMEGN